MLEDYALISIQFEASCYSYLQVLFATLISFLIEQSSCAFGMMLACISPSYPVAASVAGPILTLLSLTGGLYANVGSLPTYIGWIQYLSWFRYEYMGSKPWLLTNGLKSTMRIPPFGTISDETKYWRSTRFKADRFILDQFLMVAFIFVFYLIGYVGLSIRIYRSR
ncbi:hypothetical protein COOONC_09658 [Cooperia oncophora]